MGLYAQTPETSKLQLWHPHSAERQMVLEALVKQFNEENEWGITVEPVSFQNMGLVYDQIILQLTSIRELPNLAMIWPHEAALFDLSESIVDLTPYFTDTKAEFFPTIHERGYAPFSNKQLGWPDRTFTEMMVVNMDALQEIGYDTPPQSQSELIEMACAFQKEGGWSAGKFGVAWGFLLPLEAEFLIGLSGELPFSESRYQFNTPAMQETFATLHELKTRNCITTAQTSAEAIDEFATGQALFYFGSSSSLALLRAAVGANFAHPFNWRVFPLPGAELQMTFGPLISIFDHSSADNLAAWRFLEWFIHQETWIEATESLPTHINIELDLYEQWTQALHLLDRNSMTMPALAGYEVVRVEFQLALQRVLNDVTSIEEELSQFDMKSNQILQDFVYGTP